MTRSILIRTLLATSALMAAGSAIAQDAQPDTSDATANATIAASSVDDAQARINMLQAQIDAMQAQIDGMKTSQAKAQPSWDKAAWASSTKIGGKAFLNISSIDHKLGGANQSDNGTQTELKRFYLSVDHSFDKTFSANLTTDFRYGANGTTKDVLLYVKKAYLQAKLSDAAIFRVGAADLPWVPFVEDIYGFRYVENVLIDRTKYGTSSDWGVHFSGTALGGKLGYAASAINGAGFRTLSRSSNTIDLEGRVSFKPIPEVVLAVGGYTGKLGKQSDIAPALHRATRADALIAYVGKRVRFGAEYFRATNWGNVTSVATDRTDGYSAFGSFAVNDKVSLFGRYDWVNPNRTTNAPAQENYFNVGASYAITKGVDVAAVYKRDRAFGAISTSNGTIGGGTVPLSDVRGTYDEFGVFSQVKF
ncbi:MAG: hypothetical protein ABIR51_04135 [Sphingomicrobium sp.]